MGSSFMVDIDNLTDSPYQYARESSLLAMVIWKYCTHTVQYGTTQPSGDEAEDLQIVTPIIEEQTLGRKRPR